MLDQHRAQTAESNPAKRGSVVLFTKHLPNNKSERYWQHPRQRHRKKRVSREANRAGQTRRPKRQVKGTDVGNGGGVFNSKVMGRYECIILGVSPTGYHPA